MNSQVAWGPSKDNTERVLFVDDDALVRASFARGMRQAGFLVDLAGSADEALCLASQCHYALVVSDWRMPERDGLQLRAALLRSAHPPGFLLVTGADRSELEAEPRGPLDCEVISKPWDDSLLQRVLRREIHEFQSGRTLSERRSEPPESRRVLVLGKGEMADKVTQALAVTHSEAELSRGTTEDGLDTADDALESVVVTFGDADEALESVRRVSSLHPGTPILVVSDSELPAPASVPFIRAGAQELLTPNDVSAGRLERCVVQAAARKRVDASLAYHATHDSLTGVGNRVLLTERLARAVSRARRAGSIGAVLFLDLDHFKPVNDTYGHEIGDAVLKEAARRITSCVRDTDTVARIGGDEFAVILEGLERPEVVTQLAERIVSSFATPFVVGEVQARVTTSVGIAVFPLNGSDVGLLLQRADAAMYRSKETGRNDYHYFSEELNAQAIRSQRLQQEIKNAVELEEFNIEFQPQVRLSDHQVVAVEAFLRWPHHDGISTAELVGVLEATGLSVGVGHWLLRRVCAQVQAWNGSSALQLRAAVNVGERQLLDSGFARSVASVLAEYGLDGDSLELEVQEKVLLGNSSRVRSTLAELHELGVRVVLDDFGVGCSSLGCLQRYGVDTLKVDRSLIAQIGRQESAQQLVSALIATARSLKLNVVAEGVENEEQLAFLRKERCTAVQGYFVARPGSARSTTRWLAVMAQDGAWLSGDTSAELAVAG